MHLMGDEYIRLATISVRDILGAAKGEEWNSAPQTIVGTEISLVVSGKVRSGDKPYRYQISGQFLPCQMMVNQA